MDADGPVRELTEKECWDRVAAAPFGRLAMSAFDDIDIVPINAVLSRGKLYFRTAPGSKLAEIAANLARLERTSKKKLGDPKNPLLVSVRSGSKFSMPGMMDTILNLGLNDKAESSLRRALEAGFRRGALPFLAEHLPDDSREFSKAR